MQVRLDLKGKVHFCALVNKTKHVETLWKGKVSPNGDRWGDLGASGAAMYVGAVS